ncbi:hypothetical protein J22TS3_37950 [Paenibacillus sp. J22TS3]|nr:hypothetical protein J22TS3_37950 [Paenibacillus sp. J22TS3]
MRIVNAKQMRELDERAIQEVGIPAVSLMENAGKAIADEVIRWCVRQSLGREEAGSRMEQQAYGEWSALVGNGIEGVVNIG